jgi:hypothetical protein
MKYLESTPFSSRPSSATYRNNYPFGPTKFERELAEERSHKELPKSFAELRQICVFRRTIGETCGFFAHKAGCEEPCPAFNPAVCFSDFIKIEP